MSCENAPSATGAYHDTTEIAPEHRNTVPAQRRDVREELLADLRPDMRQNDRVDEHPVDAQDRHHHELGVNLGIGQQLWSEQRVVQHEPDPRDPEDLQPDIDGFRGEFEDAEDLGIHLAPHEKAQEQKIEHRRAAQSDGQRNEVEESKARLRTTRGICCEQIDEIGEFHGSISLRERQCASVTGTVI
ncbi:hypothetical protein ACK8OR_10765 [Jannaschia sp. KMU-145]|uniref:hypothetical protein n=1 Tax=Jannaschia halovivens TaxID=3388667 RepID=UPI00396AF54E